MFHSHEFHPLQKMFRQENFGIYSETRSKSHMKVTVLTKFLQWLDTVDLQFKEVSPTETVVEA